MVIPNVPWHQRSPRNRRRTSALGLGICIALGSSLGEANLQAKPNPPRIQANGGLVFQSQGGGTPNTFSGYLFASLSQGPLGEVLFLDTVANLSLGGAIIIGQNQGTSTVQILNHRISDNSRGVYPVITSANQRNVAVAVDGKNVIDPIEIGLCRGTVSHPRTQDLYASPDFSGNSAGPTRMNLTISGNQVSLDKIISGIQDGDGIDLNIGANAILRATVSNNIATLGLPGTSKIGDSDLTFDFRGNSDIVIEITNNMIQNAGDAAIGFSFQNTPFVNQLGSSRITISGNTFGSGVKKR